MASSDARRRKQMEKKKKKRADKRHQIAVQSSGGLAERIRLRVKHPVMECFVADSLLYGSIGEVIIARQSAAGEVTFCLFLIDRFCMGVKDCFGKIGTLSEFRNLKEHLAEKERTLTTISAPTARKYIEDAVAYAEAIGLKPHRDYRSARMILGDIDVSLATDSLEMGENGKPNFIAGPFQGAAECRAIVAKLTQSCGADGFHFVLPIMRSGGFAGISDFDELSFSNDDEEEYDDEEDDEDLNEEQNGAGNIIYVKQREDV